jgi:hypothetical protein
VVLTVVNGADIPQAAQSGPSLQERGRMGAEARWGKRGGGGSGGSSKRRRKDDDSKMDASERGKKGAEARWGKNRGGKSKSR